MFTRNGLLSTYMAHAIARERGKGMLDAFQHDLHAAALHRSAVAACISCWDENVAGFFGLMFSGNGDPARSSDGDQVHGRGNDRHAHL